MGIRLAMQQKAKVYRLLIFAIILLIYLIPAHIRLSPYAFDDAYIHLRIADNLAHHNAPYYNLGERIMASTSPGWTIFLALLLKVLPFKIEVLSVINALLTVAGAVVITRVLQQLTGQEFSLVKNAFFMLLYVCVLYESSIGLMEIPFTLLIIGLGLSFLADKKGVGFTFLSVAIFFRPEMVFFYIAALVYAIKRDMALKTIIKFTVIGILPFVVYDLVFFHTLIPNTIIAKSKVYELKPFYTLSIIICSFLPNIFFPQFQVAVPIGYKLGYFFIWLIFLTIVFVTTRQKKSISTNNNDRVFLFIMPGALIACFYIFTKAMIFTWYIPLYLLPILLGVTGEFMQKKKKEVGLVVNIVTIPLLIFAFLYFLQNSLAAYTNVSIYQNFAAGARVRKYIEVSKELYWKYPDARLLSSEIGGLGWGFKGYIMDGVGLITPQALKYHPMKVPEERSLGMYGSIPTGIVIETRPEIIVSYDVFIEDLIKQSITEEYYHYQEPLFIDQDMKYAREGMIYNSKYLNIFIRKDLGAGIP